MADSSHLERLGLELKCPICLSLFDSAVSLTCNHVFCNSCIHKSMKAGSNCPVCKVHYQRREIRPAPHMDNLVNIYKNMKVASGITLFVSQNAASIKLPDGENQANDHVDATRKAGEETPEIVKCQRKRGANSVASKVNSKRSGHKGRKSSFSTNKRVQVPQSPITESPARQENDERCQNKAVNNLINKCSTIPSEHQLSTEKERLHMSPFFWLREEAERLSLQSDEDPLTLTCTPVKAPSFSDLKDSDDDVPPEEEPQSKCNADILDSEMFEWTQRECSPELCSSPFKKEGEATDCEIILEKKKESPSRDAAAERIMIIDQLDNISPQEKNKIMDNELHNSAYPSRKSRKSRNGRKIPCKRDGNESKENLMNMEAGETLDSSKISDEKALGTSKTSYDLSHDANSKNEGDDYAFFKLPAASRNKKGTHKDKKLENAKRKFDSVEHCHEGDLAKRKKQTENQAQPDNIPEKSNLITEMNPKKPSRVVKRSNSGTTSHKSKKTCLLTSVFEQKITVDSRGKNVNGGENGQLKAAAQAEVNSVQGKSNEDNSGPSSKNGKVKCQKDMPALRKCGTTSIKCAFCHSSEETEASGEMVHYSEGRPVSAKHSEGSVIRSHKYCTEWAPNVYFDDKIAVNLEEELTRSRRIKCSLCGVKGAALGCYEKSCRKSFHVPCAKKLQECRWDADNFVILCPLHASLKLPCELAVPQVGKEKCNPKGKLPCKSPQAAVKHVKSLNKWDCSQPSEKIVLCCSALATVQKEAVSELAKSSGTVLSGSWNPSVTHVIASTNENGACKRTLKVLMGILEGKWILNINWVQACMEAKRLVEEAPYEITCDIHGIQSGPRLGRFRLFNKQPKLFVGFNFYFTVDFEPSYKGYLQELVTAAGGILLHRKPVAETQGVGASSSSAPSIVIVYSTEPPANCDQQKKDKILNRRHSDAEALAISSGAKVVNNSWVLNCIAGHKLLDL